MEKTWVGFELSTFPENVPSSDVLDYIQIGGGQKVPQKEIRGPLKGVAALEVHRMSAIYSTKVQINLQKVTPFISG